MPLTDAACKQAQAREKPYKLSDSEGLYLEVRPNGGRYWMLKYRAGGKEKRISLGVYPKVGLKDARKLRGAAKEVLDKGIDPSIARKEEKLRQSMFSATSFEGVARQWWAHWKEDKTDRHASNILKRLEADVFPLLGAKPVSQVTAPLILMVIKRIESRGTLDVAKRVLQTSGQIMRYAVQHGLAERNPAADIRPADAIRSRKKRNYARLDTKDLPELLQKIDAYVGSPYTVLAMQLMSHTFVRTSELIKARWDEFDVDNGIWRIPAERMKMKTEHIVPLTYQTKALIEELRGLSGGRELLFPGERNIRRPMSNNTILYALYRMGYRSRMTGHGFRGIASTLLHEMGFPHDHIELQLAHQERDEVSAAYNYATYVPQRAKMMQTWSDHLDAIKSGAQVIPFRTHLEA